MFNWNFHLWLIKGTSLLLEQQYTGHDVMQERIHSTINKLLDSPAQCEAMSRVKSKYGRIAVAIRMPVCHPKCTNTLQPFDIYMR